MSDASICAMSANEIASAEVPKFTRFTRLPIFDSLPRAIHHGARAVTNFTVKILLLIGN